MLDTLKLTKRLRDAGVERRVAEAMAEAFAEGTIETVGTKPDLREESAALRAGIRAESMALRSEMPTFRWQVIAAVAPCCWFISAASGAASLRTRRSSRGSRGAAGPAVDA